MVKPIDYEAIFRYHSRLAFQYSEQTIRAAEEANQFSIQAQYYSDLAQELKMINRQNYGRLLTKQELDRIQEEKR